MFTPDQVHRGEHVAIQKVREAALDEAYRLHPKRFLKEPSRPKHLRLAEAVHIHPEPAVATAGEDPTRENPPPAAVAAIASTDPPSPLLALAS